MDKEKQISEMEVGKMYTILVDLVVHQSPLRQETATYTGWLFDITDEFLVFDNGMKRYAKKNVFFAKEIDEGKACRCEISEAKKEAYREFADKLKEKCGSIAVVMLTIEDINELLKELGEKYEN